MKKSATPFDYLSPLGRLRRLHHLALSGLTHYDIKNPTIIYHSFKTNLFYR